MQCLEEAEQQAEASVDVPYPPLQIINSVPFSLYLYPLSAPFLNPLSSPSPPSLLSLLLILCPLKIRPHQLNYKILILSSSSSRCSLAFRIWLRETILDAGGRYLFITDGG